MLTPVLGIVLMAGVFFVALSQRSSGVLGFFDWHAMVVVFGGTLAALLLAIDRRSLWRMLQSVRDLVPSTSQFAREMERNRAGMHAIKQAWIDGRRGRVLEMVDGAQTPELRTMASALMKQLKGPSLIEAFADIRTITFQESRPIIEGWEMVARLAPSFGMVGTVSGMVQLFRNMAENSGNLGGAMSMALLATLYGIAFGAAVGGPLSTRVNNELNEKLSQIDLMENTVAALVEQENE